MSLRRYLFEWYRDNSSGSGRHLVRAEDAKDAMVIFEKTAEASGSLFGYKPGNSYRVHAVAEDACSECHGTGLVDRASDGHFNIYCSACKGKGSIQ